MGFKERLKRNYVFMIENLVDIDNVVNYLYQSGILTDQLKESISSEPDPNKKTTKVIDHVIRCSMTSEDRFYEALRNTGNDHVYDFLVVDSGQATGEVSPRPIEGIPSPRPPDGGPNPALPHVLGFPEADQEFTQKLAAFSQSQKFTKEELLQELDVQYEVQLKGLKLQNEVKKMEKEMEHQLRMQEIDHSRDEKIQVLRTQLQLKRMMVEYESDISYMHSTFGLKTNSTTAEEEEKERATHLENLCGDHEFKTALSCVWLAHNPGKDLKIVIEKLKVSLKAEDRIVRECAIVAFQHLKTTEVVPDLMELWRNDKIKDVRERAEAALSQLDHPQVKDEMQATLDLIHALKDFQQTTPPSPAVRAAPSADPMAKPAPPGKATMQLCRSLKDPSANVRVKSLMSMVQATDLPYAKKLSLTTERLQDPDRVVRQVACIILGGFKDPASEDVLVEIWQNEEISVVRDEARQALENIGGSDMNNILRTVSELRRRLEEARSKPLPTPDSKGPVTEGDCAADSMADDDSPGSGAQEGETTPGPSLQSICEALNSNDSERQMTALVDLALSPHISQADKVSSAEPMLSDLDRLVRQFACEAAGLIGDAKLAEELSDLWRNDCISDVRASACEALKRIGGETGSEYVSKIKQLEEMIKKVIS